MAIRDIFKVSFKTFVNPTAWIGYDSLRDQNITLFSILKSLFSVEKPQQKESFEEALKRNNITESEVKSRSVTYRRYALCFLLLGMLVFIYSFYLLFRYWTIMGWLLGMASSGLFLAQAFKYDFWSLQLRRRELGLTFKDWQQDILGGKHHG